jgi:hypothetical protein
MFEAVWTLKNGSAYLILFKNAKNWNLNRKPNIFDVRFDWDIHYSLLKAKIIHQNQDSIEKYPQILEN